MNEHRIAIIGVGYPGVALARMILAMEKACSIEFAEPQSEVTGVWIDEMLSFKQQPEVVPNIQYGPQKKRGKGKVKKW